jgi:hypothetical protein
MSLSAYIQPVGFTLNWCGSTNPVDIAALAAWMAQTSTIFDGTYQVAGPWLRAKFDAVFTAKAAIQAALLTPAAQVAVLGGPGAAAGTFLKQDGTWATPAGGFPGFGTTSTTACVGNDGRLSDSRPASDVSAWAKAGTKPSYTVGEVSGAAPAASPTFSGNAGFEELCLPAGGSVGTNGAPAGKFPVSVYESYGWNFTVQELTPGQFSVSNASRTTKYFKINHGGVATFSSYVNATDFVASSDERLKENVRSIFGALGKVLRLRGVGFQFRDDATHAPRLGLIAQEVQREFPEVVHAGEDGMLSVSYGSLVGALVEAIKAQQVQIDAIRNRPSLWRRFLRWLRRI